MAAPGIERAAHQVAIKVKKMVIEMLTANQQGSVSVEVGRDDLQPVKHIEVRGKHSKVSRGQATPIEHVEI